MKRITCFLFALNICFVASAQEMIRNGGFEEYDSLPFGPSDFVSMFAWMDDDSGLSTSGASTDYYHTDAGAPDVVPPDMAFVTADTHTGNAIAGFVTYAQAGPNYREYLGQRMESALTPGVEYTFSMHLTNGVPTDFGGNMGADKIGVAFATSAQTQFLTDPLPLEPVWEMDEVFFSGTWEAFTFTFTPDQAFTHIYIGNFRVDAETTAEIIPGVLGFPLTYYLIDDVSLTSDVVIDPDTTFVEATICSGDTYSFDGEDLDTGGTYSATDSNGNVTQLDLTVLEPETTSVDEVICEGDSFEFLGNTYTESGTYEVVLEGAAANGCDLIGTLVLEVLAPDSGDVIETQTICAGSSTTFFGETYSEAGVYEMSIGTGECTATAQLTLVVTPTVQGSETVELEEGSTVQWGDQLISEPGLYTQVFTSVTGCDSLVNLVVTQVSLQEGAVYVPNSFSPNNDGVNDTWAPVWSGSLAEYQVEVFNRWGELIYRSNDPQEVWLGDVNGGDHYSPDGLYAYRLRYRFVENSETIEVGGHMTMFR